MTDADRLVAWSDSGEEMVRLERAWRDELSLADPSIAQRRAERFRDRRVHGVLDVYLWDHPEGTARGFVACEPVPHVGRRVEHLFLETGVRDAGSFGSVFDLLDHLPSEPGPVFASTDLCLGVPLAVQTPVLTARGFVHFDQDRMVFRSTQPIREASLSAPVALGHPEPRDIDRLIDLYVRAYRGDPTQLLWPQVRLRDDAAFYVHGIFSGTSGIDPIAIDLSFVAEREGRLVGAILMMNPPEVGPFVSDLMVDPAVQRHGIGRRLLLQALSAVRSAHPRADVTLTVETQNRPAVALYTSLGFTSALPQPGQRSGAWLRKAVVDRVTRTDPDTVPARSPPSSL